MTRLLPRPLCSSPRRLAAVLMTLMMTLLPLLGGAVAEAREPAPATPARTGTVSPTPLPSPRTAPRVASGRQAHGLPLLTPAPLDKSRPSARLPRAATPAQAAPEQTAEPLSASITTAFEGMDIDDTEVFYEPPDTHLAVGPSHVVETVNVEGRITDRTGTALVTWNLQDWLHIPADYTVSDPRVFYDRVANRWLIVVIGANYTPWTGASQGYAWVVISNTGDPAGSWYQYTFTYGNLPDFPGVALSDDKIVITSNGYSFGTASGLGADTLVINKAQAYAAANSLSFAYFAPDLSYFTIQPAQTLTTGNDLYMAAVPWIGYGLGTTTTLHVFRVTGVPGVSTVTRALNTLTMPYGVSTPPDAEQPGTAEQIRTNDDRLLSAVWYGNHLWLASTTGCTPAGDSTGRACAYWAMVDTSNPASPTLSDWGVFSLAGYHYYFPAVTVDGTGNAYLVVNRSGTSEYASVRVATRPAGGAFSGSVLLRAGAMSYVTRNGQRWGDYSGAAPDPSAANAAWVAGEYAKGPAANLWGTYIARLSVSSSPATTWFFAEGYTGTGFDEYLTLQNPNAAAANITLTYYLSSGGPITKTLSVDGNSRSTVAVHDTGLGVGRGQAVSARVSSDEPIVAERPMYFSYGPQGWTGGHVAMGATSLSTTWYFAEGYTGTGFDEFLTIQNPNPTAANITLTYYLASGGPIVKSFAVPGSSRFTVPVHETDLGVGRGQAVSARVSSDQPIVAERPMYFSYGAGGWTGGHDVMGATSLSTTWYFAEGYTGTGFDEYLTIQNPNPSTTAITTTYYLASGGPVTKTMNVPGNSRATIAVNDPGAGVGPGQAVSARVEASQPVVAERPMYFSYGPDGWTGGHVALGAASPATTVYFAEGYTATGFDEYLTIQNPNSTAAAITITYYLASGGPVVKNLNVPGSSRYTVKVHESSEGVGRGQAVSARVTSTQPVVVERPMYFSYVGSGGPWTGGHDVMGYAP